MNYEEKNKKFLLSIPFSFVFDEVLTIELCHFVEIVIDQEQVRVLKILDSCLLTDSDL